MVLSNHLTPPDELQGLARALAAARLDLRWSAMVRFERGLRGAVLRDLATAGCRTLQFGLEAVDAADLNRLRKGVRPDTVERVLDECRAAGIRVDVTVMAFPGQRPGGFARTLAYLLERVDRVNSVTPVRFLLPSTAPVSEHPEVLGLQPQEAEDDLDVFDLPYVAPGELPADEFDTLVRDFRRAWADRGGRGGGSVA